MQITTRSAVTGSPHPPLPTLPLPGGRRARDASPQTPQTQSEIEILTSCQASHTPTEGSADVQFHNLGPLLDNVILEPLVWTPRRLIKRRVPRQSGSANPPKPAGWGPNMLVDCNVCGETWGLEKLLLDSTDEGRMHFTRWDVVCDCCGGIDEHNPRVRALLLCMAQSQDKDKFIYHHIRSAMMQAGWKINTRWARGCLTSFCAFVSDFPGGFCLRGGRRGGGGPGRAGPQCGVPRIQK